MLLDEDVFDEINLEPVTGILAITLKVIGEFETEARYHNWGEESYDELIKVLMLFETLQEGNLMSGGVSVIPEVTGELTNDCEAIYLYVQEIYALYKSKSQKLKAEKFKKELGLKIKNVFSYEFSQGDLDRVQCLINELREHISSSDKFEANHKQRLLSRLEKLQSELHKRMSDLDRFWGLIGDAGVAVGKFGEDAKPIVDRIREITEIILNTQGRAEELPSDSPLPELEDKNENK